MKTKQSTKTGPLIHHDEPELATQHLPAGPKPAAIDAEDPAHERERQAAFDAEYAWRGVKLHGFTSSREALFSQHRLAMGAPSLQACLDDLDAFLADAARILWLCHHTPDDWGVIRSSPVELQKHIDLWADDHIARAERYDAVSLAFRIYIDSRANEHTVAPSNSKGHGDDLGN